jgi:cytochrome b561
MALKSEANRWGVGARALHWIMAVLIISLGLVGLYMSDLPNSPQKIKIYALHKSIGLTVLALLLLRLAWRMADRRPDEVPMPRWQALAARAVHGLLYVLMFALPLSGWLYNSASGYPLQWFSLFNLPSLTGGADPALKGFAHDIHAYGFYVLALALLAHVGGALKHHFIDRDETLVRMLPLLRRRRPVPMSREPVTMLIETPASLDTVPEPPADPSQETAKP